MSADPRQVNADTAPEPPAPPARRAGSDRLAWVLLICTVVFGTASDLVSKHLAFARLADAPVVVDKEQVLAKKAAGIPLNHTWTLAVEQVIELRSREPERYVDSTPIVELGALELMPIIPEHEPTVVVPSGLEFTLLLNEGAVFGSAAGKRWWFVGFTFVALMAAVFVFARLLRAGDRASQVAVGLIIAGGLGNLYDRIVFACVRDFLHPLPGVKMPFGLPAPGPNGELWPYVSNVADAWLLVGVAVLMVKFWRADSGKGDAEHESDQSSGTAGASVSTS